jgi:hypothetical protein
VLVRGAWGDHDSWDRIVPALMCAYSRGFRRNEINRIQKLIEERREHLRKSWDEYFDE